MIKCANCNTEGRKKYVGDVFYLYCPACQSSYPLKLHHFIKNKQAFKVNDKGYK